MFDESVMPIIQSFEINEYLALKISHFGNLAIGVISFVQPEFECL